LRNVEKFEKQQAAVPQGGRSLFQACMAQRPKEAQTRFGGGKFGNRKCSTGSRRHAVPRHSEAGRTPFNAACSRVERREESRRRLRFELDAQAGRFAITGQYGTVFSITVR
jgi:hypothetical protein